MLVLVQELALAREPVQELARLQARVQELALAREPIQE